MSVCQSIPRFFSKKTGGFAIENTIIIRRIIIATTPIQINFNTLCKQVGKVAHKALQEILTGNPLWKFQQTNESC